VNNYPDQPGILALTLPQNVDHTVQHFCQYVASHVIYRCLEERTGFQNVNISGQLKVV
jgi:hypothetical protein